MLGAAALWRGSLRVEPHDLRWLRLLTTFRVPPDAHDDVPAVIDAVLARYEARRPEPTLRSRARET